MSETGCVLHWFRNDLRLADNPALTAATARAEDGRQALLCCFIACPAQWQAHDDAPIKLDFLRRSLIELGAALERRGMPLFLLVANDFADVPALLERFARSIDARALFFNEEYAVNEQRRDQAVSQRLKPVLQTVNGYRDQSIWPVRSIRTAAGTPYKVFTPFKRRWLELAETSPMALWPKPSITRRPDAALMSAAALHAAHGATANTIDALFTGIELASSSAWAVGETAAHDELESFMASRVEDYHRHRNQPALEGTSRLSRFLANGTLSGRQCYVIASDTIRSPTERTSTDVSRGVSSWINELIWRDFYIHLMADNPRLSKHEPFRQDTDQLQWRNDQAAFEAWCAGRTGIPIIDAAMRQLDQTGWMHNRLRMITAMFLTKNLFLDWRLGERHFMRALIDGYLPSNNGGWQWSASTGTDSAPYFRVFNPVNQSRSHDADGSFIRRYVPEIAGLDNKSIHDPTRRQREVCGYPEAIVDLKATRAAAIDRFKALG